MDDPNLKWLTAHDAEVWEKYAGQWIAVAHGQVAGASKILREAYEEARKKFPGEEILFDFVEESGDVIYLLL